MSGSRSAARPFVTLALGAATACGSCAPSTPRTGGGAPPDEPSEAREMMTPSASVIHPDGLVLELETDRHTYAPGDPIRATLKVRSEAADEIVMQFGSGQRYDLVIERGGSVVWRWSEGMFFIQVLGQERLAPGDEISYSETYEGELTPGTYTVRGSLVSPSHPLEASVEVSVTTG